MRLVSGMLRICHEDMAHPLAKITRRVPSADKQVMAAWNAINTQYAQQAMSDPPPDYTLAGG